MNYKRYLYVVLFFSLVTLSCKKNVIEGPSPALTDIQVPEGFDWETSRNVNFKVGVSDNRFEDAVHLIAIYKGDPNTGGILLSTGGATINKPFESKIYLADTVSTVYIVKKAPDNSSTTEEVRVAAASVDLSIGQVSKSLGLSSKLASLKKMTTTVSTSPDCTTGCTKTEELNFLSWMYYIEVKNGQTVCINGSNKSFNVSFGTGGGTVRICGQNLSLLNLNDGSNGANIKVVVTKSSSVSFNNLNLNSDKSTFENYGTASFPTNLALKGILVNYGTLNITGDYNINTQTNPATSHTNYGTISVGQKMNLGANCTFTNMGNVTVNSDVQINSQAKLTNENTFFTAQKLLVDGSSTFTNLGKVTVTTDLGVNSQGKFINKCNLWVKRNLNIDNIIENHSYIKVDNDTRIQGNYELGMYNAAMIKTGNLYLNRIIKGYGSTSLVKVSSITDINGSGVIADNIQFCDANGIEKNKGKFTGNAALGCNLYIPVTECNAEGNGEAAKDADKDGVTDALDAYPNDQARAFNNYYPSGGADAGATLVFEDNWPRKGDYDLNDLAISYKYQVVTNAGNQVVDVVGNFSLYATGGSFNNGFGVEFPINRSSVSSLVGGPTLEDGQTKAVVVLFNDMREQMVEWNTIPNTATSPAKNYTFTLTLKDGPTLDVFGLGVYNPFIWNSNSGSTRGIEIHLPGMTPTDLANKTLFGTDNDHSNIPEGRYYVTSEGLPWGLNIPVNAFEYPIEKTAIAEAYLKFHSWVQSGGSTYLDWYINKETGYRNESKIFNKK